MIFSTSHLNTLDQILTMKDLIITGRVFSVWMQGASIGAMCRGNNEKRCWHTYSNIALWWLATHPAGNMLFIFFLFSLKKETERRPRSALLHINQKTKSAWQPSFMWVFWGIPQLDSKEDNIRRQTFEFAVPSLPHQLMEPGAKVEAARLAEVGQMSSRWCFKKKCFYSKNNQKYDAFFWKRI